MRKIDESFITNTAGMPVKAGVLAHLQNSYQEILAALATLIVGPQYNTGTVYILFGCINSGSGLSYVFSAGAVFYNGEVFLVPAVSFVAASGQVAIGNINTGFFTDPTGDPIQFTDGSSHNVLQIRTAQLSAGLTTTGGLPDFSTWVNVNSPTASDELVSAFGSSYTIGFQQDLLIYFTTGLTSGTGTINWNFNGAVPGTVVRLKLPMSAGTSLTIATPSGSVIINENGGAGTASKTNYIYAMYCGVDDGGNHAVSYKIISL